MCVCVCVTQDRASGVCSDEGDDGVYSYINDCVSGQLRHRLDPLHTHTHTVNLFPSM